MLKGRANHTDKYVAQRLKLSRIYHGLNQQQMAQAINGPVANRNWSMNQTE